MQDEERIGPVTGRIADWVCGLEDGDIPQNVVDYAKLLILDGIGCSILGSTREAGQIMAKYALEMDASGGKCAIWGRRERVSAQMAALVNSTSAHSSNVGDTHPLSIMHTNYLMPQGAIAVAETEGLSGREVLTSIIVGTEIAIRAALATHVRLEGGYFNRQGRGWHSTGGLGAIGVAATTAKLLGLDFQGTVQALVIAGTQPAGVYRPCGAHFGKHLFAGLASSNGIRSGYIARQGFTGGYRLFEDGLCYGSGILSPEYEIDLAHRELGSTWETLRVDMAVHPTKKTYMATLDALLDILHEQSLRFEQIDRIEVFTWFGDAPTWMIESARPRTANEAFNSLRYVVAAAAHDGRYWFDQLEAAKFRDPAILDFAENRVSVLNDSTLKAFGESWPASVRVITREGREHYKKVECHRGQASNALSREQAKEKFVRMTEGVVGERATAIAEAVQEIEGLQDMRTLTQMFMPQGRE